MGQERKPPYSSALVSFPSQFAPSLMWIASLSLGRYGRSMSEKMEPPKGPGLKAAAGKRSGPAIADGERRQRLIAELTWALDAARPENLPQA